MLRNVIRRETEERPMTKGMQYTIIVGLCVVLFFAAIIGVAVWAGEMARQPIT